MTRIILAVADVKRKRPLDIARTILRHLDQSESVDHESVNQKAPLIFGYPNSHAMHSEAGKTPLPAPGMLSRMDIQLGLTKNLKETVDVPFLSAFRAVGKAKLRTLDIDRRTVEGCAEASNLTSQENSVGTRGLAKHQHLGEGAEPNTRVGKLIAAIAPGYRHIVRKNGSAFDWSFLMNVCEAIDKTANTILLNDPVVAECRTTEEAIDVYLQKVVIPEAWVPIEDLVADGLEVPHHEVIALYTKDGRYIGRVIHHAGLNAVIPKLFYTDDELAKGKVNFFLGRHQQNLSLGRISHGVSYFATSFEINCDEPVYVSWSATASGLSVKTISDIPTVDVSTLQVLPALKCGFHGNLWAIDGQLKFLCKGDRSMYQASYASTDTWASASNFPLLFPLEQDVPDAPGPSKFSERFKEGLLLPPETGEFQQRLFQKLKRDIADARQILEDPAELPALLRMIFDRVSVEQIERTAEKLEATYYAGAEGASDGDKGQRFEARRHSQQDRPRLIATSLEHYPFLGQFGPATHWVVICETLNALSDSGDSDLPVQVAILVELVVLASASAAGKPPERFRFEPTIMAVGRWAEGRASIEEIRDLASLFSRYQEMAIHMEAKVGSMRVAVSEAIDCRERARELGVAYAGERVTVRPSGRITAL